MKLNKIQKITIAVMVIQVLMFVLGIFQFGFSSPIAHIGAWINVIVNPIGLCVNGLNLWMQFKLERMRKEHEEWKKSVLVNWR